MILSQTFESSSSTAQYHAKFDTETGAGSCDCPGWKFKRGDQPRTCKHLKLMAKGAANVPRATFGDTGNTATPHAAGPGSPDGASRPSGPHNPDRAAASASRASGGHSSTNGNSPAGAGPLTTGNGVAGADASSDCDNSGTSADPDGTADHTDTWAQLSQIDQRRKPMLACAMKETRILTIDGYANPDYAMELKYDGWRVLLRVAGARVACWSRPRAGAECALDADLPVHLMEAAALLPDGLYDGEQFLPGGKSWHVGRLENKAKLRLVLFDVLELLGQDVTHDPVGKRRDVLDLAIKHYRAKSGYGDLISMPDQHPVSADAIQALWDSGEEGVIIKRLTSTYQPGKRSADWVKVKQLKSEVFTITGFKRGKAASSTPFSTVCLRHKDGRETTVSTKDNETLADVTAHPERYIGQELVAEYTELTDDGGFRHPRWKEMKWDHMANRGE